MRSHVVLAALAVVLYVGSLLGTFAAPVGMASSHVAARQAPVAVVRYDRCDGLPIPC